ncbi:Glucose-1-phosphate cytidylyltransferase [Aureliella helgolandensis]|uniref:Glucose-1-phosphate cytidylyltransferase n=2 Tax=Aureliella helgolandensis TaxID=2527968 RepID=A0A518GHG0_9BACT|nr:Glucose-1-phosphate cytidylyltransferase [Aureliella helgolandensis]
MREETEYRPKPLVEIGGRPILWHIMKMYAHYGMHEFVLCLGYRGQMIRNYFLQYEAMNNDFTITMGQEPQIEYHKSLNEDPFKVTLAETGLSTMTGGRILRAAQYLDDDTFMLTYGDGVSNVDIDALLRFHRQHGRLATVTVVRSVSRFGMMDVDTDGSVLRFVEKPVSSTWASAGFFVLNHRVLSYLTDDSCVFEQEPLERLAAEGQMAAFRHDGFFYAMDTYREYQALNKIWDDGTAAWKVW